MAGGMLIKDFYHNSALLNRRGSSGVASLRGSQRRALRPRSTAHHFQVKDALAVKDSEV
jgi:hypothetical protein